jgi:hypothetical protein
VESVEINKTLAPNLDGDGIGGSVNMRTKTAGEFPTVSLYGIGGYNPILSGRYNDQFGGTIGHRFGKQRKLGILFGATTGCGRLFREAALSGADARSNARSGPAVCRVSSCGPGFACAWLSRDDAGDRLSLGDYPVRHAKGD